MRARAGAIQRGARRQRTQGDDPRFPRSGYPSRSVESTGFDAANRLIPVKQHFIDGRWTQSAGGEALPVVDPSTGEVIERILRGTAADIDAAVRSARKAVDGGPWGKLTATERGRL